MRLLRALAGSRWLTYVLVPFLALGGYRAWLWQHDRQVAAEAVKVVVEQSKEHGRKANATNEHVRARTRQPGAAKRLRSDPASCRDCGRAVSGLASSDHQPQRPADGGNRRADRGQQQEPARLGLSVRAE